jgi:pimeloyl-ACP methyl ester carboxylesterase
MGAAMIRWAVVLLAMTTSGCVQAAWYFLREPVEPMDALEVRMDPDARRECLVVLVPGLYDLPDHFFDNGFIETATGASRRCDIVVVDAHVGYYQRAIIRQRLGGDILRIAEERGYREVWLVGISMGGLGCLLVAQDFPDLVRGVVLIAPWLGDEAMVHRAMRAGLARYRVPRVDDRASMSAATAAALSWLQGYVSHPDRMPQLYVGVGRDDRLRSTARMIAAVIPRDRYDTVAGAHGWAAWRALWLRSMRNPPWDPH